MGPCMCLQDQAVWLLTFFFYLSLIISMLLILAMAVIIYDRTVPTSDRMNHCLCTLLPLLLLVVIIP